MTGYCCKSRKTPSTSTRKEFKWEGKTFVRGGFWRASGWKSLEPETFYPHEQTLIWSPSRTQAQPDSCDSGQPLSDFRTLHPDEAGSLQGLDDACIKLTPSLAKEPSRRHPPRVGHQDHAARLEKVKAELVTSQSLSQTGHITAMKPHFNYRKELTAAGELTDDLAAPNFVLMQLVGMQDPGLQILPTHRIVSGLPADLTSRASRGCTEILLRN